MKNITYFIFILLFVSCKSTAQKEKPSDVYTYKSGDPSGIGKWYMNREIAHVMGFQGIGWLERSDREEEENTSKLIKNMDIQPGNDIADIGAGSGYHVFRMASLAETGTVYAVDIQDEMLASMKSRKKEDNIQNVTLVKGSTQSVSLPENSVDKILMVDVYHEFDFPVEMVTSMKKALRQDGKIYLIEYRGEDRNVPIKRLHKMTEKQAVSEMKAAGFKLQRNIGNLPWQHCMIFVKE
jgi:protein-L-isoaspartate O-methyltransferase